MTSPAQHVRAAAREAEFALSLLDMLEILKRDRPRLFSPRQRFVAIWPNDFGSFVYREGQIGRDALLRRWERWKTAMRQRGLGTDVRVDWVEGAEGLHERPIVLDVGAATRWAEGQIERHETLAKSLEPHRRRVARDVSVKSALEALGIDYTPSRLRMWLERGAPFDGVRRGSRTLFFTNVPELEGWIERAVADGTINDPFQRRIPIAEARSRLMSAIEKTGLTKSEFARRIGTTRAMLESYVMPSTKVRTVPADVVERADQLAEQPPNPDDLPHSKLAHRGTPPLSAIRDALQVTKGDLRQASKLLAERGFTTGITPENLSLIARRHEIPYVGRIRIIAPDVDALRDALVRQRFNLTRTAAEFGISAHSVSNLIERHGLKELVDKHMGAASAQDLIEAIEAVGHDAVAAGELLGISESRFRFLLGQHGLTERFEDFAVRDKEARFFSERDKLEPELRKAVAAGETRNELAQRLGMPRTSVEAAVRRLRLRDLYNELPYEVGAKARGSTREITSDRVPFWHAALTELMERFPQGGAVGLAKRLGMAPGVSVLPWVRGKRVPRYDTIEKIMSMAGRPMPDWRAVIESAAPDARNMRELAEATGISRHGLYSMLKGHVNPSEKMLEKILGDAFWVEV